MAVLNGAICRASSMRKPLAAHESLSIHCLGARTAEDLREMAAPWRMEDLFNLTLRLTHRFIQDKQAIFRERIASKGWL
ncbi:MULTISPECIES: nucleotidyltransferase family protein [Pseudomonas]|jgi:hypothetical protein|uniref:nucleotidyltransferase family protein n=1 Tax=Pseudomonas TaxID=286 RepID=UPI0008983043|nr:MULTISPECIES: nucleotidyltransferase family protein [Pseudomonas]MBL1310910.1 nucleotidyltransferase family protein [Pseudomonas sp.]MDR6579350.1 hypothetical protein [Pseudomonas extremaustralis]PMX28405.1 hypothetical protein C1Y23_05600 [Pseudomonas sp. GW460-12]PMX36765.1 hypothetical protein C1Y24_05440 [Pseudomonas sp. MPR-R2A4]PMX42341.1 hypothetical protein C1Y26_06740 [Pseudomonas sp. MPR-R2A7]